MPFQNINAKMLNAPSGLRTYHSYAVIDAKTGELLMGDKVNEIVYPASTTKLMTAIAIIEHEKGDLNKTIKITSSMLRQVPSCLSQYGIRVGQKYTLKTLLHMTLIASDGDAAICAAIGTFGSVDKCIQAMNKKVKELKLTKTNFDNPAGLDIGDGYNKNYTTAYEMAIITQYAMKNEMIRDIVSKATYKVVQANGIVGRTITSTNKFYKDVSYPKSKYTIIGSKSGTTNAAGHVFAATANDNKGHEVICVYMGRKSRNATFEDIRKIFNTVFDAQKNGKINLADGRVNQKIKTETLYENVYGENSKIQLLVKVTSAEPSVSGKSKVGKVSYQSSNEKILTVNSKGVVSIKDVGEAIITVTAKENTTFQTAKKEIVIRINPAAVMNVASEVQEEGINITWDKVPRASGYYVYRKTIDEEEWTLVNTTEKDEYYDKDCLLYTTYQYKIITYAGKSNDIRKSESSGIIESTYELQENESNEVDTNESNEIDKNK